MTRASPAVDLTASARAAEADDIEWRRDLLRKVGYKL